METKQIRQSKPKVDLTGKKFGRLTPQYYIKGGKWHCKCDCGNELDVDTRNLNSGHTKSCGCLNKEINSKKNTIDLSNFENEGVKVLERDGSTLNGIARWKCLCKYCGRVFTADGHHLREGSINSCGCVHSYNERNITKLLIQNNIPFAAQYIFPDLTGKDNIHPLRFDFAIFNKDNTLSHLIEYNGKQHYFKTSGTWGENFETLQENDQKKIEYCKEHNIELRIIKYDQQYTIEDLI